MTKKYMDKSKRGSRKPNWLHHGQPAIQEQSKKIMRPKKWRGNMQQRNHDVVRMGITMRLPEISQTTTSRGRRADQNWRKTIGEWADRTWKTVSSKPTNKSMRTQEWEPPRMEQHRKIIQQGRTKILPTIKKEIKTPLTQTTTTHRIWELRKKTQSSYRKNRQNLQKE